MLVVRTHIGETSANDTGGVSPLVSPHITNNSIAHLEDLAGRGRSVYFRLGRYTLLQTCREAKDVLYRTISKQNDHLIGNLFVPSRQGHDLRNLNQWSLISSGDCCWQPCLTNAALRDEKSFWCKEMHSTQKSSSATRRLCKQKR